MFYFVKTLCGGFNQILTVAQRASGGGGRDLKCKPPFPECMPQIFCVNFVTGHCQKS